MRRVSLKLNVPFCLRSCSFCTRQVLTGWDSARTHAYMEALRAELLVNAEQFADCAIEAVRFGGGSASMAGGEDVSDTMRLIRNSYRMADDAQITMRAAICNFSGASMPMFKRAGIQRFDLEMLSLDPLSFHALNKTDALGDFPVVCDYFLRSYANDSLGVVLIYGHSRMERVSFRRSVLAVVNSHAVHLQLQCCEGTEYAGDAEASDQLGDAEELLTKAGFVEYVPRHFARPGQEDVYFINRDKRGELLGFGLGAQTILDGIISTNTLDFETYLMYSGDYTQITASVVPCD
jgi:oxygen-independent coproporphyrinogen-3 oxidase